MGKYLLMSRCLNIISWPLHLCPSLLLYLSPTTAPASPEDKQTHVSRGGGTEPPEHKLDNVAGINLQTLAPWFSHRAQIVNQKPSSQQLLDKSVQHFV